MSDPTEHPPVMSNRKDQLLGQVKEALNNLRADIPQSPRVATLHDVQLSSIQSINTAGMPQIGEHSGNIMDQLKAATIELVNEILQSIEQHSEQLTEIVLERILRLLIAPGTPNIIEDSFFQKDPIDEDFTLTYNIGLRDKIIRLFFIHKFYNLDFINEASGTDLTWEEFGQVLTLLSFDIHQFTIDDNDESVKRKIGPEIEALKAFFEAKGYDDMQRMTLLTMLNSMGNDANFVANALSFGYAKDLYMNFFINFADCCNYALIGLL